MNHSLLHRLAQLTPGEPHILSIYLDLQFEGERPEVHPDLVRLRSRLHAIEQTLWPRRPQFDDFQADVAQVEQFLKEQASADLSGLACFVSHGRDLFETIAAEVPFRFEVAYAPIPHLYQAAQFLEDTETSVVAVVDRETVRLFVVRLGTLTEVPSTHEETAAKHTLHYLDGAGMRQYEPHFAQHRKAYVQEVALAIERLALQAQAVHILLVGNQEAIPLLRDALSKTIRPLVQDVTLPLAITQQPAQIQHLVGPLLQQMAAATALQMADQVMQAVQAHDLGIVGLEATRTALANGQVRILVLTADASVDEATRNELTRLAELDHATLEVVPHHDALAHLGGIGALLRYREMAPR